MTDHVLSREDEAVYGIALNRPECGNLVTTEMVVALSNALTRVPRDTKLVVITGKGADFCKGRDYQAAPEDAKGGRAASALELRERMTGPIIGFYTLLKEFPVPTLAVVQGAAYGFGSALAGGCDIVLAGESARFRLPEMTKGLPPTLAMAALDKVTAKGLAYLVYSTAEIDARSALAIGLASTVAPDGELVARANRLIGAISSQPLDAVKAVKEYLKFAPQMDPRGRGDFAASVIAGVLSSR
jgi:enoyl-CoA hydratase